MMHHVGLIVLTYCDAQSAKYQACLSAIHFNIILIYVRSIKANMICFSLFY
jgi:hypothetical protein